MACHFDLIDTIPTSRLSRCPPTHLGEIPRYAIAPAIPGHSKLIQIHEREDFNLS